MKTINTKSKAPEVKPADGYTLADCTKDMEAIKSMVEEVRDKCPTGWYTKRSVLNDMAKQIKRVFK